MVGGRHVAMPADTHKQQLYPQCPSVNTTRRPFETALCQQDSRSTNVLSCSERLRPLAVQGALASTQDVKAANSLQRARQTQYLAVPAVSAMSEQWIKCRGRGDCSHLLWEALGRLGCKGEAVGSLGLWLPGLGSLGSLCQPGRRRWRRSRSSQLLQRDPHQRLTFRTCARKHPRNSPPALPVPCSCALHQMSGVNKTSHRACRTAILQAARSGRLVHSMLEQTWAAGSCAIAGRKADRSALILA